MFDLSRLAAKQKRYADWHKFTKNQVKDRGLQETTFKLPEEYKKNLAQVVSSGADANLLGQKIDDIERQLEQLNSEARLRSRSNGAHG